MAEFKKTNTAKAVRYKNVAHKIPPAHYAGGFFISPSKFLPSHLVRFLQIRHRTAKV